MRIHTVDDPSEFADGDAELATYTTSLLEEGLTNPEWWFIAEDRDGRRGRIGLRRQVTVASELRGELPESETYVFGVAAPWDDHPTEVVGPLVEAATAATDGQLRWRIGTYHADAHQKAATAAALGLPMFHEKIGFLWRDDGADVGPTALELRTLEQVGDDYYAEILSRVIEDGPDREANWYSNLMPPGAWGAVMVGFAQPEDRRSWVVAFDDGEVVGQVAVSAFDPDYGDGTIAWIGVLPEHRGRGVGSRLLREAQRIARSRGFGSMLSDTDTLNVAMQRTFVRTGHRQTEWHVWHHRWPG